MKKIVLSIGAVVLNTFLLLFAIEAGLWAVHRGDRIGEGSFNRWFNRKFGFVFDPAIRQEFAKNHSATGVVVPTTFSERPILNENPVDENPGGLIPKEAVDYSRKGGPHFWVPGAFFEMIPGNVSHSITRWKNGALIYDVEYRIDRFGRRETENPHPEFRNKHLMLFGCSFMFGEGQKQGDTLPSRAAAYAPSYFAYNYGVQGVGPQEIARRIEDTDFSKEVPQPKGVGLYLFIPDHIRRTIPSISYLGFRKNSAFFGEDESGNIKRYANFGQAHPVQNFLYQILTRSEIFNYFSFDIPSHYGEEDFRKTAHLIGYLADAYIKKFPQDKFYVVLYPYSFFDHVMTPYLESYGVKVLDYSHFDIRKYIQGSAQVSPVDGHPSAAVDDLLAAQITKDLGLNR